ncbi:MAG: glycoside hydrolase family 88 protein [Lachnospiraceae bacterium]
MATREEILSKLELLGDSFKEVLYYEDDDAFLNRNVWVEGSDTENALKFIKWDWFHGVGLYGFWKLYKQTKNPKYLDIMTQYYDERIKEGLPDKNVNSTAPLLTLAFLYEETKNEAYLPVIKEWSEWLMNGLAKTPEGGFQHTTSASYNKGELWDDTLFMTVLFLTKAGLLFEKEEYIQEAAYQFMVHTKYLADKKTGLWFHGWTFEGDHNFANALWARGNSWITISTVEFLEMTQMKDGAIKKFLLEGLKKQMASLKEYQHPENGLWYTIINETDNYVEASGSAGFAFGMLKASRLGLVDEEYYEVGEKAIDELLNLIDEKGMVHQVSIGTPMGVDLVFYKNIGIEPMSYGQALVMLCLVEKLTSKEN